MDKLLQAFRNTFEGHPYLHRNSTLGDAIASYLYDDMALLGRSPKLVERVELGREVVNTRNRIKGRDGRRGDGTFGELIPGVTSIREKGYLVRRGPVATLQIGAEVKIVSTKMIAQIDRVMSDLRGQADTFRRLSPRAIAVGIVGVNFADEYTGYEGKRQHIAKIAPGREADEVVRRINQFVRPHYDELVLLPFRATNRSPFFFEWVNGTETSLEYSSAILRLSNEYNARF
ncbi:MAG: hypothetical protein ACREON_00190 [Gemmatimonadaceae bacterium]